MNDELMKELERLREYEKATRDTICWGVGCVHEAWALNALAEQQAELDELKEEVRRLKGEPEYTGEIDI